MENTINNNNNSFKKLWIAIASLIIAALFMGIGNWMYQVTVFMNAGERFTKSEAALLEQRVNSEYVPREVLELELRLINTKLDVIQRDINELRKRTENN